jgi:hypothetical protein
MNDEVRVNAQAKSPSVLRVVVIAGATAVLASAVTPASAASAHSKRAVPAPKPQPPSTGGSSGPISLQWMIGAPLRP